MTTSGNPFERIEANVARLLADHRRMAERCRRLEAERQRLGLRNRELEERLTAAEQRVASLELATGLAPSGVDRKRARARINRLLREVDRCIALLNR